MTDSDGAGRLPADEPAAARRLPAAEPAAAEPVAARNTPASGRTVDRRLLDEIFGDVLPSVTQDEMTDGSDRSGDEDRERWYRDNTPPHHG